jgi:hypothetical protein
VVKAETIWVAKLEASSSVVNKINAKHSITLWEVEDAVLNVRLRAFYTADRKGVMRYLAKVTIRGRIWLVALYPSPDLGEGCYRLGTVFDIAGQAGGGMEGMMTSMGIGGSDCDDLWDDDETPEQALAAYEAGRKVLAMPPEWDGRIRVNYVYTDSWSAASPDLPWLEVTASTRAEAERRVREEVRPYLGDAVVLIEKEIGVSARTENTAHLAPIGELSADPGLVMGSSSSGGTGYRVSISTGPMEVGIRGNVA